MAKLRVGRFTAGDLQQACDLARLAHAESLFSDIAFSEAKFLDVFDSTLEEPNANLGLKVSFGGRIVGFSHALLGEHSLGDGVKVVTVTAIATVPEIRSRILGGRAALRLVRGVKTWAEGMEASYIIYHAASGTNPTNSDRFFRKLGMTTLGGNYGAKLDYAVTAGS